ncbi:uncharacterized protein N7477_007542 [Penicillium maclennaniae]|uniref:uncharacterized protein n=1 Tax=Penicillium maclennaniae TaxID=1343394 RepID=UPI00253F65DA|nr:uncharacterized protein N7477_007542 [Penicillium maclennaniae]KAJ5665094.1 hypothetical protein N7477_007542 [Penicillium maclennaniae]
MMRTAVLPSGLCSWSEVVTQLFQELEAIRRFGNIAPAMEVVETVWRQQDLSVQDERKHQRIRNANGKGEKDPLQGARFSWEHAMVMLGDWKVKLDMINFLATKLSIFHNVKIEMIFSGELFGFNNYRAIPNTDGVDT